MMGGDENVMALHHILRIPCDEPPDVLDADRHEPLARLTGRPGDVGRDVGVGLAEERVVGAGRLVGQHVGAVGGELSALQGGGHGLFVDESAASGVDEDGTGMYHRQRTGVDHAGVAGRQRTVQRDDVGGAEQPFERRLADPLGQVAAVPAGAGGDVHAHGVGDVRHALPDVAEPDDADGLFGQLDERRVPVAEVALSAPLALPHGPGIVVGPGGDVQQECEDVLCDAVGAVSRDVADDDAPLTGGLEVDVVVAGRQLADILQAGQLVEHFARDAHFVDQDAVGLPGTFHHLLLAGMVVDGTVGERLHRLPGEVAGVDCMAVEDGDFHKR